MEGKKRHSLGGFAPVLELGENRPKGGRSGSLYSHLKSISTPSSIEDSCSHSLAFNCKVDCSGFFFFIEIHFHKYPLNYNGDNKHLTFHELFGMCFFLGKECRGLTVQRLLPFSGLLTLISSDVFQDKCSTICFITDGLLGPGSESNVKSLVV